MTAPVPMRANLTETPPAPPPIEHSFADCQSYRPASEVQRMAMTANGAGQFVRLGETDRAAVLIHVDGEAVSCLAGDTVLTALLLHGRQLRVSEFGDGPRAGFCNMGACQDCWISLENGERLRACTTYVEHGLQIVTQERPW